VSRELIHASCVAFGSGGGRGTSAAAGSTPPGPLAVLLRGPSGAGKSDLALRLIDQGARLVADDQTELSLADGMLLARSPQTIRGKMEVRGLGIADLQPLCDVPVGLVVDLTDGEAVERMPESETCAILGVQLPLVRFDPFEASTPAKLRLAVARLQGAADAEADEGQGDERRALVLVTGMSGAGRSTALSILEDIGYESIDNLPLDLLQPLIAGGNRSVALGVDIRTRGFAVAPLLDHLDRDLNGTGMHHTLLFLDCEDAVLGRRYTETRRRHPLGQNRPIADGIAAERSLLLPLRARADLVIDTSALTPAELRQVLTGHFRRPDAQGMTVCITSFAYRNGLPREADLVLDVRFLRNPHYAPDLRALTGRDDAVDRFIAADPRLEPFFNRLTDLVALLLPEFRREGKNYLTIAFGCTGGRHRSVAIAERLAAWFADRGEPVTLVHRELGKAYPMRPEGP